MILAVNNISCGYDNTPLVRDITFRLGPGETLCLLGPNGVGKTTFYKTLLGFIPPQDGEILIDGQDINRINRKELAKKIAYVPQSHKIAFAFTVEDVVLMGRIAWGSYLSGPTREDRRIAYRALEELGIGDLGKRCFTRLSGGERQMVLIARGLAQEAEFLVLDEPTSNLDFGNQIKVLNQIKKLGGRGMGIIMTTHSPDHVFLCSTRVMVFHKDARVEIGLPEKVVTEELLKKLYNVDIELKSHNNLKICVPCFT